MLRPQIMPRIVIVGLIVFLSGALLATLAYIYEMSVLNLKDAHPLFDLFADGFKVGLGAFIGVLSQWATRVFADAEEEQKKSQRNSTTEGEPTASESAKKQRPKNNKNKEK